MKMQLQSCTENEDAATELYWSSLEEKLVKVKVPKDKFNNQTNTEWKALHDLKNEKKYRH